MPVPPASNNMLVSYILAATLLLFIKYWFFRDFSRFLLYHFSWDKHLKVASNFSLYTMLPFKIFIWGTWRNGSNFNPPFARIPYGHRCMFRLLQFPFILLLYWSPLVLYVILHFANTMSVNFHFVSFLIQKIQLLDHRICWILFPKPCIFPGLFMRSHSQCI